MDRMQVEVSEVCFGYEPGKDVLRNVTFSAKDGECVGIIGANGAGKSTLLRMFVGLLFPDSGTVRVGGKTVGKKNLAAIRRQAGYVFQEADNQLFMSTVYEDVAFAPANYGLSGEEVERRVASALEQAGITHLRDTPIHKLSGGEKKLASIASVLSMEPSLLLMDEPTTALDPKNRRNFINLLQGFSQLRLLVIHDLDMVWDVCERVILLDGGVLVADGQTREILSERTLLEAHGLELPLRLQK